MNKKLGFLLSLFLLSGASAHGAASDYMRANTYNNMYPYMNNKMRTSLNPGVNPNQNTAQINVLTRTIPTDTSGTRRVVARSGTTARTATTSNTARAATTTTQAASSQNTTRRVVARSGTTTRAANARTGRGDSSYINRARANVVISDQDEVTEPISSARCLSDYTTCMNGYCEREDTEYNRCYCSSKLAQIDSMYQPEIERLITEIITIQGTTQWTQAEMDEYWMDTVGKYSGENSWANLDAALNFDWASTDSRVRGQNAFNTGHEYCVQHLRGCYYMAANLRDAYRSEISRDCATYEESLQRLKSVAESVVEYYKQ